MKDAAYWPSPFFSLSFFSFSLAMCSPNMLDPTPRFLVEVFAKRDFGLALSSSVRLLMYKHGTHLNLLSNLLTSISAQLGRAGTHNIVRWRDI
jgi:hypothetical protein